MQLSDTVKRQMRPSAASSSLIQSIAKSLEAIAGFERIWRRGVVHRGGPHYRLRGAAGPVSIGEDELAIFGELIERFRPSTCFIIGNGFGVSSVFISKAMEAAGGVSVVTLDDHREGDGQLCSQVAEALRSRLDCQILQNKYGSSPQDVPKAAERNAYDLIFIDGDHSHPQVTRDFWGVANLLARDGILCWHDYWLPGVSACVTEARNRGYHCLKVNSSCEMVFGTQDERVFAALSALFPEAEIPNPRGHIRASLLLSRSYSWTQIKLWTGLERATPRDY